MGDDNSAWGTAHTNWHFFVGCAFLFYVFMCGTLIESLMGQNLRKFVKTHTAAKMGLGFLVVVFTIGFVSDMPSFPMLVLTSLGVLLWFLCVSQLSWQVNVAVLICLLFSFAIHEYERKTHSQTDALDNQPRKYPLAAACMGLAYGAVAISAVAILYDLVPWPGKSGKSAIWAALQSARDPTKLQFQTRYMDIKQALAQLEEDLRKL
jgi:hypothetical protein